MGKPWTSEAQIRCLRLSLRSSRGRLSLPCTQLAGPIWVEPCGNRVDMGRLPTTKLHRRFCAPINGSSNPIVGVGRDAKHERSFLHGFDLQDSCRKCSSGLAAKMNFQLHYFQIGHAVWTSFDPRVVGISSMEKCIIQLILFGYPTLALKLETIGTHVHGPKFGCVSH